MQRILQWPHLAAGRGRSGVDSHTGHAGLQSMEVWMLYTRLRE